MYRNNYQMYNNGDRQFLFPFLLGGLAGGAAVGLTRPRPVFVNQPYYQPYPYYSVPYGYTSYNYYYPRYY